MAQASSECKFKRHYNPTVTRSHHYGPGATQRLYEFENGHPTVSVICCRELRGDGSLRVLLDKFEVAILNPGQAGSNVEAMAFNVDEEEVQRILFACAAAYKVRSTTCL